MRTKGNYWEDGTLQHIFSWFLGDVVTGENDLEIYVIRIGECSTVSKTQRRFVSLATFRNACKQQFNNKIRNKVCENRYVDGLTVFARVSSSTPVLATESSFGISFRVHHNVNVPIAAFAKNCRCEWMKRKSVLDVESTSRWTPSHHQIVLLSDSGCRVDIEMNSFSSSDRTSRASRLCCVVCVDYRALFQWCIRSVCCR